VEDGVAFSLEIVEREDDFFIPFENVKISHFELLRKVSAPRVSAERKVKQAQALSRQREETRQG
jgi:hypothetical protein